LEHDHPSREIEFVDVAVVRFAGDSGDGMQLTGEQFTTTSALMGDEVATLPDYPAEIRAPAGTVFGVSGFQLSFGSSEVYTPGDQVDVLVAMNPAAYKTNLASVRPLGTIIVNDDAFTAKDLEKAGYTSNPLDVEDKVHHLVRVPIAKLTAGALADLNVGPKQADLSKNFFALGLTYWLFHRSMETTEKWIMQKFKKKPDVAEANLRVLRAGYNYGEAAELFRVSYEIRKTEKHRGQGLYRYVTGNQAAALGLMAAAQRAGLKLFLGSYPITPATDILHELSKFPEFAKVFQAEDEIAAIGSAIGASFGGALAVTTTSGPGLSLKSEFMNLAVITELPLVIIDVQRAGPSTGIPTKTEQSDLMQALHGRHGESPLVVIASSSPHDCFEVAVEAARIAVHHMTPVIMLSDGYLGNGAEVWRVPDLSELPEIKPNQSRDAAADYKPYKRDPETLARMWAVPGMAGYEHRLGGLEKEDVTGTVSHNPENHEKMTHLRAEKIARVANDIPLQSVDGDADADTLVVGWGSTYGPIQQAVKDLRAKGVKVASANVRYLKPMPKNLGEVLARYKRVLVAENNMGQLAHELRAAYPAAAISQFNKVQGLPFRAYEIEAKIRELSGNA
jgi:2-oxoglutarate ferredoxin oxidoreductase subunit alpha